MNAARVELPTTQAGPEAPKSDPSAEAPSPSPSQGSEEQKSGDRPSWLPEKFKTAEDMAKAYSELESKQGKKTEADPEIPRVEGKPITADELQSFQAEYTEKGGLSDETYATLEARGFDKSIVDSYVQGQIALAQTHANAVFGIAGGKEGYMSLLGWAKSNLSTTEAAAADKIIQSGDFAAIETTLNGLMARREKAEGRAPASHVSGRNPATTGVKGFSSDKEVSLAMRDPRYRTDPSYRAEVEDRLRASKF